MAEVAEHKDEHLGVPSNTVVLLPDVMDCNIWEHMDMGNLGCNDVTIKCLGFNHSNWIFGAVFAAHLEAFHLAPGMAQTESYSHPILPISIRLKKWSQVYKPWFLGGV